MLKIKDLEIGKSYTLPLVVTSVTARETKTKKPYLALEFYDGTDKIAANYWDWSGKAKPEVNAILDVTAQVTSSIALTSGFALPDLVIVFHSYFRFFRM